MKKFILFFTLSLLLVAFGAFFINTYELQKDYFQSKFKKQEDIKVQDVVENIKPSAFIAYTKEQYDLALSEKRVLVLFFTSNWCKECLEQESILQDIFKSLDKEGVVGFSIHILDSETTTETDALAKKFDVTKESSFVILNKDGSVGYRYTGSLSNEALKNKILDIIK